MKNVHLLIIDPQYDFIDIPSEHQTSSFNIDKNAMIKVKPSLPVKGSWEDCLRLAHFLKNNRQLISHITLTLDNHQIYDIGHPEFWRNNKDERPQPYTIITKEDIELKVWHPVDNSLFDYIVRYADTLERNNKHKITVWPEHCLVNSIGHNIIEPIANQLQEWERQTASRVTYIHKGHHPLTEHYGGFQAEVPIEDEPSTQLALPIIKSLEKADSVLISGQALSHCVASTVNQLAEHFDAANIGKLILLEDTSSPVEGFEKHAKAFIESMTAKGMQVIKTTDLNL